MEHQEQIFKVGEVVYCVDESMCDMHLTKRKAYQIHALGEGSKEEKLRIKGDYGRLVWILELFFSKTNQPKVVSINIDDEIKDEMVACIEVIINFENGHSRWTTFMTTEHLKNLNEYNDYTHFEKIIYVITIYTNRSKSFGFFVKNTAK
ncbi:MAG: hypothetical protein ACPGXL_10150, partial [Chitinophagales bacterium]